jgi:mono/diheme cytochrome c family protein
MKRQLVSTTTLICSASLALAAWFANGEHTIAAAAAAAAATTSAAPIDARNSAPRIAPSGTRDSDEMIARGAHLVLTSGCNDCHTPLKMGANGPEPDLSRMLSGHPEAMKLPPAPTTTMPWIVAATATNTAWAGPWGVSFTANLTPDKDTGLGSWTREEFVQTIRTGRHHGRGRAVLPPMPIPAYRNFSDQELNAIFAFLATIPAVKNRVPDPLPPRPQKGAHG